jgi:surface antigen
MRPRRLTAVAALLSALCAAGCAYQFDSTLSKVDADAEQAGAIGNADRQVHAAKGAAPSEVDLAYARAVAADVVGHGAKDSSIPWENPTTGAGGNITPLAASYNDGSLTCRDFLASYVRGQAQAWLQGEACRAANGKWEVRSLRPFKQS